VPKPEWWNGGWSLLDLSRRIESAFQYSSAQAIGRLVEFTNLGRSESLSEAVARQLRESLDELKRVEIEAPKIHDPDDDPDDDPPSAAAPIAPVQHRPVGLSEGLIT
jgi:hypothetical protein